MESPKKFKYLTIITAITLAVIIAFYIFVPFRMESFIDKSPVKLYYADNISGAHQAIIDKFNELNKGKIEVIPINLPFYKFSTNERKELLTRALRSKSEKIDIFSVDIIWVERFAKWSASLEKVYNTIDTSKIISAALKPCYYKNELFAFPMHMDVGIMYYDYDLINGLKDAELIHNKLHNGITWKEFIKLSKRKEFKDRPFYTFPGAKYEGFMCSIVELLYSQNPDIFEGEVVNLNVPEAKRAIKLLYDLVHTYKISPKEIINYNENDLNPYLGNKNGAFIRGWPSFDQDYSTMQVNSSNPRRFSKALLPHFEGSKKGTVFGGWNLMISKWSNHKDEAMKFLKFILSEEVQQLIFEKGPYLPVRKSFYIDDSIKFEKYPDLNLMKEYFSYGFFRPIREDYTRISDIITYYFNEALEKNISLDDALKFATNDINSGKTIIK